MVTALMQRRQITETPQRRQMIQSLSEVFSFRLKAFNDDAPITHGCSDRLFQRKARFRLGDKFYYVTLPRDRINRCIRGLSVRLSMCMYVRPSRASDFLEM